MKHMMLASMILDRLLSKFLAKHVQYDTMHMLKSNYTRKYKKRNAISGLASHGESIDNLSAILKTREAQGDDIGDDRATFHYSDATPNKTPRLEDGRGSNNTFSSGGVMIRNNIVIDESPICRKNMHSPSHYDFREFAMEHSFGGDGDLLKVEEYMAEETSQHYKNSELNELIENKANKVHSLSNLSESVREVVAALDKIERNRETNQEEIYKQIMFATHDPVASNDTKDVLGNANSIVLSKANSMNYSDFVPPVKDFIVAPVGKKSGLKKPSVPKNPTKNPAPTEKREVTKVPRKDPLPNFKNANPSRKASVVKQPVTASSKKVSEQVSKVSANQSGTRSVECTHQDQPVQAWRIST